MQDRRRQPAGDVVRDVLATDRDAIRVDSVAFREDGDRGRAAAHVDQRRAELHFVFDEGGEARRVGRFDYPLDVEVAALDAGREIPHRAFQRGDPVNLNAEAVAEHTARVIDAVAAVDAVADRDGV